MGNSSKGKKKAVPQTAKAAPSRETPRRADKPKNRQSLWIRIGIGVASLAMIGFTVSQFVPSPGDNVPIIPVASTPTTSSVPLLPVPVTPTPTLTTGATAPLTFVGMDRTTYTAGTQALSDINRLHGTDIILSDGYSAVYSWTTLKVSVWVGLAGSSADAATLVRQMTDTINKGGTAFTNALALTGQNVVQAQGPGGSNYFYQSTVAPNDIVWLTIQAPDSAKVNSLLQSALTVF